MAKKRIGEIATAHDLNPKEVVKQLQEAGFSVQSPTSTIEENLAMKVLRLGENAEGGGAQAKPVEPPKPRRVQPAGSQPRPLERRPRQGGQQQGGGGQGPRQGGGRSQEGGGRGGPQGGGSRAPERGPRPPRPDQQRGGAPRGSGGGGGGRGGGGRSGRPTRDDQRTGERAPNAGGGPRRVVIDSQASRRQGGGPPPQVPRRPVRRSRRRRGTFDETIQPLDTAAQSRTDTVKVNSGSTVKDVSEYLGVPVPEIIKKLMTLGEMATLTQTLSD